LFSRMARLRHAARWRNLKGGKTSNAGTNSTWFVLTLARVPPKNCIRQRNKPRFAAVHLI
jgi:hypothetical protein